MLWFPEDRRKLIAATKRNNSERMISTYPHDTLVLMVDTWPFHVRREHLDQILKVGLGDLSGLIKTAYGHPGHYVCTGVGEAVEWSWVDEEGDD